MDAARIKNSTNGAVSIIGAYIANITSPYVDAKKKSQHQRIYLGQPYAGVDLNPMT